MILDLLNFVDELQTVTNIIDVTMIGIICSVISIIFIGIIQDFGIKREVDAIQVLRNN